MTTFRPKSDHFGVIGREGAWNLKEDDTSEQDLQKCSKVLKSALFGTFVSSH